MRHLWWSVIVVFALGIVALGRARVFLLGDRPFIMKCLECASIVLVDPGRCTGPLPAGGSRAVRYFFIFFYIFFLLFFCLPSTCIFG